MAAVQLARHLGAEVYATASPAQVGRRCARWGSPTSSIASSRTLEFEQRVPAATGGRGVDVVLDSLAGEFVDASLRLLPRGGRFVEMGKTDMRDPDEVRRRPPRRALPGVRPVEAGPERHAGRCSPSWSGLFEHGALAPLPVTAWDVRRAPEAFRYLSQAPPRRQGRADRAGAAGPGRHRADHRRHRRARRAGRPAPGRPRTGCGTCCWSAAAARPPPARRSWSPS